MKFQKKTIAVSFAAALAMSSPAQAGVPTLDYSNLVEAITNNINEMKNWAEEKAKMALEMDMEALMNKLSMANLNNAFSNMIARSGAALQNIQNLEMAEQMAADSDICSNVAFSLFDAEVNCYVDDRANAEAHDIITDSARYDLPATAFDKHREDVRKEIIESCDNALTVDASDVKDEDRVMYSQCLQAGSMLGLGTSDTFSDEEEKAVESQIRLITGPTPERKRSTDLVEGSKQWTNLRLEEMRGDAFKSIPVASFTEISKWRKKASESAPLSRMQILQEFVDERTDPNWILKVGGGKWEGEDGDVDTTVYRTELLKKMTVLELKQTEIQLEQFKHQLRLEGINAAMLSLMIDPL